ncbi:FixH family protein [Peribacillus alkalitolerans]|uniref:FixH family protein n=1 Tax=Peribacillus alkalitolerans TaxID=1550385 RepID=UPI0013D3C203|nr:FixH family protein [Peribacillus alkalitolerans]
MKKFSILLFVFLLMMVGCTQTKEDVVPTSKAVEMIDVTIQTPTTVQTNEKVKIEALVTFANKNVNDASEVLFEIWKSGQDKRQMLDGRPLGKGIYSSETIFKEDGKYFIVAHVTARNMHAMPKKEVVATSVDKNTQSNATHTHQHEHSSQVSIDFQPTTAIKANKDVTLSAKVLNEGQPLEGATVTFEILKKDQKKPFFIDAVEGSDGRYKVNNLFPTPGTYKVKVHVKKNHIHEHQQDSIEVN